MNKNKPDAPSPAPDADRTAFPRAADNFGGWTIDPKFLMEVQLKTEVEGWNCGELEGVQSVLLQAEKYIAPAPDAPPTEHLRASANIAHSLARAALEAAPDAVGNDDADKAYEIGKRNGYEEAVQHIDILTGGDGEYFFSTFPGEGCPDPVAMKARIVERFEAARQSAEAAPAPDAHPVDPVAGDGWETMMSAPRDGSEIDLACASRVASQPNIFVGMFWNDDGLWEDWHGYLLEQKWRPYAWSRPRTPPAPDASRSRQEGK